MVITLKYFEQPMEVSIVVAVARATGGIGIEGRLPWRLAGDLKRFREITTGGVVVMGRKTWESLPPKHRPLPNRVNVILTRNATLAKELANTANVHVAASLDDALNVAGNTTPVYVIGGQSVYDEALHHPRCNRAYVTMVDGDFKCDAFFPSTMKQLGFVETNQSEIMEENGIKYQYVQLDRKHEELQYLELIDKIILQGNKKGDRTGTGTMSLFGAQMRFSLRNDVFPLLTTKRVFWKGVAEELLWFISGDTNAKTLQDKGIKIWDGNGSREYLDSIGLTHREAGDLGPVYGFQWRHFGAKYVDMHTDYTGQGVDQLADVINKIKNKPDDRRILLSAWNPSDLGLMALPPCHMFCQFYVADGELSCQMYQRSADMGLGVPFNIASYALLTRMIAQVCGLKAGDFIHVIGDAHVYLNHIEPLKEQLSRTPRPFPTLRLNPAKKNIDDFTFEDFTIENYTPHKTIKMEMSV
ncbi:bifunctional dihydrofolate reductase-thymidylate synthase 2 [Thraustotheca clavata]|uniref:Bifunctional dihydrofolate reductase-thymidylate synthase n=1 Tax=Thraustotheca clavata TaxID=74557 RepID=A0A1W0A7X0_9STRA|nr:bifunctional dihydrofolate reductase-thymidylate synthase 2 [Thraustotheca clavata]